MCFVMRAWFLLPLEVLLALAVLLPSGRAVAWGLVFFPFGRAVVSRCDEQRDVGNPLDSCLDKFW